jgi:predicted DNA-binding transcriptional regulator YafY
VADLIEITYHVLGFAPHAEAVTPKEFRTYWLKRVKDTAKRFTL